MRPVHLGRDIKRGEQLQFRVPAGTIFGSEVLDASSFGLVSCAVAPGFDYHDFELFTRDQLLAKYPEQAESNQAGRVPKATSRIVKTARNQVRFGAVLGSKRDCVLSNIENGTVASMIMSTIFHDFGSDFVKQIRF